MVKKAIYFFNGALGSGKTTLINQLIQSGKLGNFFLIENEVSSFSVDNMCLHLDPKQIKVFAGECICCSDPKELVKILEKISQEEYENIVIESSGVTSLNQLLSNILVDASLQDKYDIGGCVFLVDALGLGRTNVNDLEIADFVVVTKFDELKSAQQHEKLDDFFRKDFPNIKYVVKNSINDSGWIDSVLNMDKKTFRQWSLKVNNEKHHGQNFVQVLLPHQLTNFVPEKVFQLMKEKEINRVKGFWTKNGLVHHIEATPELLDVKVSVEKIEKMGVVVIGSNKFLLDECIKQIVG